MCKAYATSPSAFSGGHTQLSSTTPVTSSSPAPRTGIPNSSLAKTRPTFVPPPKKKCNRVPSNSHSLVKKCYGCGQLLKMKGRDGQWHIPPAPNDLIIIIAMRRSYGQNDEQKRGQLGNVYFHCRDECGRPMQPAFLLFLVVIPSCLQLHLLLAHRQHLALELQLVV